MAKWLDKYEQGGLVLKKKTKDNYGKKPNVNDVKVSAGPGFEGDGYTAQNWKSPAWGGQFAMGGALPGAVGFTYARTAGSAPANGKYTKKTKASAQDGTQTPKVNSEGKKLLYPKTIDPAFKDVYEGELELFDPKDFDSVKKQIGDYMTSNTYLKRLNNFIPDKRFANRVQLSRASALLNAKLLADKPDDGHYNAVAYAGIPAHSIQIRPSDTSSTVAHELGHSIFREQLSDNPNSTTGALGLNPAEMAAVLKNLNRENIYKTYTATNKGWEHPLAYYDEHYDTRGGRRERDAVNETYGDLTSVRKLLNDNGITKKFGDDITPEMWKKASENPKINKVPTFKRMRIKYKDDDIIKMNNSVAQNDNDNLIPIAQDGTTIDPNDVLPKGYPRTITKDVNANYDPFKNLWSGVDPKDITRRLEINPIFKQAALDAKAMSKKEFKDKYKDNNLVSGDEYGTFKEYDPKLYDFTIQRLKNEQEAYNNWTKSKQQFIEDKANKESFIGAYNTKKTEADEYVAKMSKKYGYTPGEDTSAHRAIVNKMINEANEAINTGIGYPLPNNPASEMTCINGICTIASNAGVDFSPLKGLTGVQKDSEGRYIPQFNPTFVQNDNYKKAGFRKLNPDEQPEAGDLAQYGDDGRLHHMELVLERTPQGMVTFNNYQQTKESKPGAGKADRPFKKGSNQASQFATTDYYRLDPTIEEKIESKDPEYLKKIEGKKKFESSDEAKAYKDYENYLKSNEETYNQYKSYLDKLPKKQNGGEMSFYQNGLDFKPKSISKNGSVIKDDRGQWAHPGEVTEIGSNDITMQGVDYPVLGISDTGDTKMMQPGEDYKFDGEKVTEFPMAQNGKWLKKYSQPLILSDATRNVGLEQYNRAKLDQYYKSIDPANQPSISQWNPKPGEVEAQNAREAERVKEYNNWVSKFSRNPHVMKGTKNLGDAGMFAIDAMTLGEGALALNTIAKPIIKAATKKAVNVATNIATKAGTKAATKASSSNYVKDLYYSGKSYVNEIAGEQLAGAENRKAIAEGNKWFEDWANHPETAKKIKQQIIDQKTLGKNNPEIFDRIDTPETMQDYRYLTTYKPGATEYPLADQTKDLIKTILGNNKYRTPMVHGDNFGVSYRHGMSKWSNMDDYVPGDRFSGPGTWISRTPAMDQAARKSITIHENAHDWLRSDALERLGFKDEIQKHLTKEAIDSKAKFIKSGYNFRENYLGYLAHETEVLSRVMETRLHFGLTPTDKVTSEMAEGMLKAIREGKTPINKQFADIFSSPKGAAKLFNKLPAIAPVAVGVGAAATTLPKEQKNGGWLNKYK